MRPSIMCAMTQKRYALDVNDLTYKTPEDKVTDFITEMADAWILYGRIPQLEKLPDIMSERPLVSLSDDLSLYDQTKGVIWHLREMDFGAGLEELRRYSMLISGLVNMRPEFADLKDCLERGRTDSIRVHDAYPIFCMLHPESVQTAKVSLTINDEGETEAAAGGRHEMVVDIDFDRFKEFLYNGMRISNVDRRAALNKASGK